MSWSRHGPGRRREAEARNGGTRVRHTQYTAQYAPSNINNIDRSQSTVRTTSQSSATVAWYPVTRHPILFVRYVAYAPIVAAAS